MEQGTSKDESPRREVGYRTLLTAAAVVVVIAGLKAAGSILVPVLLAAFLAVLSYPPITWLRKLKLPTWAAVLVVFTVVIGGFVLVSIYIGASVKHFTANIPDYQESIQRQIAPAIEWIASYGIELTTEELTEQLDGSRLMAYFAGALSTASSVLSDTLFVILTTIFIIAEAAGLPGKVRVALGRPDDDLQRFSTILGSIQSYLSIKTQVSLVTGVLAGVVVFAAGVDFPLLWALLAFLLNYVPTLGSIIAAVPPVILATIESGWQRGLIVGAGFVVINLVMGNVIEPRLMGRRLGLSTLVVFLSLVFWGYVWGPLGMLLCVPLTMLVKILLENSDDLKWLAVMLGSGAEVRERNRNTTLPPPPEPEESPPSS